MENYKLKDDETILYQGFISTQQNPKHYNSELVLTNFNIVITTKIKKFLIKEEIYTDVFDINSIKTYNNQHQVIRKNDVVHIYLLPNELFLKFQSTKEAKIFVETALKLLSGESKFIRNLLKAKESISHTTQALGIDVAKIAKETAAIGLKTATTMATIQNPTKKKFIGTIAKQFLPNESNKNTQLLSNAEQVEQLTKLKKLLDDGAITQSDYEKLKSQILGF